MIAVEIRKAEEKDRISLSHIIAMGFEQDFSALTKDMDKVAKTLCNGIEIDRFYVVQQGEQMIGAAACSDNTGRAIYVKRADLCLNLGILKGMFSYYVLRDEFMKPLSYSSEIGFIEFLTVRNDARGNGIAKQLLKGIVEQSKYKEFVLEVTNINTYAIKAYSTFGFVETHRVPSKHPRYQGYDEKVIMRYKSHNCGQNNHKE